jgi:hypothetical protein
LLAHKKAKQIARDLGLSFSAVEERIRSGRQKLGAPDRTVAVRLYAAIREDHRNPVPMFEGVESLPFSPEELIRELDGGPPFSIQDSQTWGNWGRRRPLLETFDERFGMAGRVGLILACFVILCIALGSASNFFEALNRIM